MPRYQPVKVGESIKVCETYTGDRINVRGEYVDVTRQQMDALRKAAEQRKMGVQEFIDSTISNTSAAGTKAALRNAMWKFLPADYVVPIATRMTR
jgi:hypothetical protein